MNESLVQKDALVSSYLLVMRPYQKEVLHDYDTRILFCPNFRHSIIAVSK